MYIKSTNENLSTEDHAYESLVKHMGLEYTEAIYDLFVGDKHTTEQELKETQEVLKKMLDKIADWLYNETDKRTIHKLQEINKIGVLYV